ncbi:MAG: DUF523 domain-containing protein [Thermodesulfobacteriota bacterium]|nr:DUF523 domain-containing protein [Thermodesulfobacteriota bacterium]
MIIVSACLLGFNCRYDGESRPDEDLLSSTLRKLFVPICPEQLGGLPTPRAPSEIIGGDGLDVLEGRSRILSSSGSDVTDCFLRGANEAMRLVELLDISTAIMKEKSPSCGVCHIKRNGSLLRGSGVTSALLIKKGLRVISSDRIKDGLETGIYQS